ncbi:hypothetical protein [Allobranchiibius sp. CTAmp26]|uniref:hypothetical protein n=1 Tax=Allobranchiibius sp. CTAmp26 TaxID=2815214 RepID=UPI001AA103DC|nr:hypothetical protein [Allobranchiibius sp. CTAmp26]MBO1753622.1 hypothetical protein [Allobranchiibius sp. CTAmp26]
MFKTLAAVAGATALAGTGIAMSSAPAHAAAPTAVHAKGSVYLHGTSTAAHFWSRSDCNTHASWEMNHIKNATTVAALLPATTDPSSHGELRFTCYPVQGAQWSYVVAYKSTTGNPVAKSDRYVDVAGRNNGTATSTPDADNVWLFDHGVRKASGSVSVKTCTGWLKWFENLVTTNPHARLALTDNSCSGNSAGTGYDVVYFSTTKTAGLRGDHPFDIRGIPMLDVLGYNYGQNLNGAAHARAWYAHK